MHLLNTKYPGRLDHSQKSVSSAIDKYLDVLVIKQDELVIQLNGAYERIVPSIKKGRTGGTVRADYMDIPTLHLRIEARAEVEAKNNPIQAEPIESPKLRNTGIFCKLIKFC